jgi:hypothetical protein
MSSKGTPTLRTVGVTGLDMLVTLQNGQPLSVLPTGSQDWVQAHKEVLCGRAGHVRGTHASVRHAAGILGPKDTIC